MLLPAASQAIAPKPNKPRRRHRQDERRLQGAIVRCLRLAGYEPMAINIELPIPGEAGVIARAIRKQAGAVKGTPDIIVPLVGGRCIWLEIKLPASPQAVLRGTGIRRRAATKPTTEQTELHGRLERLGHRVAVVWAIDDALEAVRAAHKEALAA